MEFEVSQSQLKKALEIVTKVSPAKGSLPTYESVLIQAKDSTINFTTTDSNTVIKHEMPANVILAGEVAVNAKHFYDIVKMLDDALVNISIEDNLLNISCLNANFNLASIPAQDFPQPGEFKSNTQVVLPVSLLKDAVKKTIRSTASEKEPPFNGLNFVIKDKDVTIYATDTFRVVKKTFKIEREYSDEINCIISAKLFEDIINLSNNEEVITIELNDTQIKFGFSDTTFISRLIEGNFPNLEQIIPTKFSNTVTVSCSELVSSLRKIMVLNQLNSERQEPIKIILDPAQQEAIISINSQGIGNGKDIVKAQIQGEEKSIGINPKQFLDGVAFCENEIVLKVVDGKDMLIINDQEDPNYLYLLMLFKD